MSELAPALIKELPLDVMNGQPLHYERVDGDHYRIWSVGWDGRDDGGVVGSDAMRGYDAKKGDWVWKN